MGRTLIEFPGISLFLERPFLEDEVHNLVFAMKGDKTPSLDGFSISFFFFQEVLTLLRVT